MGVHHGEQGVEGCVDLFAIVVADAAGCCLGEGAKVVGLFQSILGHPCDAAAMNKQGTEGEDVSELRRDWKGIQGFLGN